MVSAVSKATEDTTGTVSLAEAIATKGPDGILFHTRCVLGAAVGSVARLVDGATACDIAIEPAEAAAARADSLPGPGISAISPGISDDTMSAA